MLYESEPSHITVFESAQLKGLAESSAGRLSPRRDPLLAPIHI